MTLPDDFNLADCQDFFLQLESSLGLAYIHDAQTNQIINVFDVARNNIPVVRALYTLRSALCLPCDMHSEEDTSCPYCLMLCAPCEQ